MKKERLVPFQLYRSLKSLLFHFRSLSLQLESEQALVVDVFQPSWIHRRIMLSIPKIQFLSAVELVEAVRETEGEIMLLGVE